MHRTLPLGYPDFALAVADSFVPLRVAADETSAFHGMVRGTQVGSIHVSQVDATPHWIERTPELIARGHRPHFKLSIQLEGTGLLVQGGREALLRPGDITLYRTDTPYSIEFARDYSMLVFMFDLNTLGIATDALGELTAVRIPSGGALTRSIAPFLMGLGDNFETLEGPTGARLVRTAVDLTATLYAAELGATSPRGARPSLIGSIMRYIDDHLASPSLDPAAIATAHHISLRYLHMLFEGQGVSVARWIKRRRLERCHEDLRDPLHRDEPVAVTAARWGFVSAAHFNRTFKQAYGSTPGSVRAGAVTVR